MNEKVLKFPYIEQSETSANCGPCSVKSIIDYFNIKKENGDEYTVHSINKYLKTSHDFGCDEEEILNFFDRINLRYETIDSSDIKKSINKGYPVLSSFKDELNDGHYAVIIGHYKDFYVFMDPWPKFGKNYFRDTQFFEKQLDAFDSWLISVTGLKK